MVLVAFGSVWKHFWLFTTARTTSLSWVEARCADKYPSTHRTALAQHRIVWFNRSIVSLRNPGLHLLGWIFGERRGNCVQELSGRLQEGRDPLASLRAQAGMGQRNKGPLAIRRSVASGRNWKWIWAPRSKECVITGEAATRKVV